MISAHKVFLRLFACVETSIFFVYILWGAHGIGAIRAMQEKNRVLTERTAQLEQEIQQTSKEISDWKNYPFYKEQYAREHLQMARKDDKVYLL